jgi:hypothetical protein
MRTTVHPPRPQRFLRFFLRTCPPLASLLLGVFALIASPNNNNTKLEKGVCYEYKNNLK